MRGQPEKPVHHFAQCDHCPLMTRRSPLGQILMIPYSKEKGQNPPDEAGETQAQSAVHARAVRRPKGADCGTVGPLGHVSQRAP